jgi:Helix-loop-helix DNA-binding domain
MSEYQQHPESHAITIKTEFTNDFPYSLSQTQFTRNNSLPLNSPLNSPLTPNGMQLPSHSMQQQQNHSMQQQQNQRTSHAEKRANHNAIERARRESLNIRFLELAQSIPSLVHVRKPSKSIIVSRSIEYISETKQRLEIKTRSLDLLRSQNEEFKQEINRLRSKLGMGSVIFPDSIDLDLVFEANLEHQKEVETRNPSSLNYSTNFRNQSPFDGMTPVDSDDDRKSPYSLLSPLTIGDRDERPHSGTLNVNHSWLKSII